MIGAKATQPLVPRILEQFLLQLGPASDPYLVHAPIFTVNLRPNRMEIGTKNRGSVYLLLTSLGVGFVGLRKQVGTKMWNRCT